MQANHPVYHRVPLSNAIHGGFESDHYAMKLYIITVYFFVSQTEHSTQHQHQPDKWLTKQIGITNAEPYSRCLRMRTTPTH